MTAATPEPWTPDQRKAELGRAVASWTAGGSRVESMTDYQAVMVSGKPVNHVLHLLLSVFTCGAWAFVWIYLAVTGGESRSVLHVDEWGNFSRT